MWNRRDDLPPPPEKGESDPTGRNAKQPGAKCDHDWIGVMTCTRECACRAIRFHDGFWKCAARIPCEQSRPIVACRKCFIKRKDPEL